MKIILIAGARPNFMKIAPVISAIKEKISQGSNISYQLVHTGQHYDKNMSDSFFEELGIPYPDVNLECGGGSQAEQTANIMVKFERYLLANPADLLIVVGDVTSTLACSIVAKKNGLKIAHIEGGLRSGDMSMPEEINRIVTDSISDYFFTTSVEAGNNLKKEGKPEHGIFFVGNTMIDSLLSNKSRFIKPPFFDQYNLKHKEYFVLTLHRPSNVDQGLKLQELLIAISNGADGVPVVFPVHPRTMSRIRELGIAPQGIIMVDPQSYFMFNYLVCNALGVITDSGGITEETTVMSVPCITLRESTERPETITTGTNELIGTDANLIAPFMRKIRNGEWKKGAIPALWDGKTGARIAAIIEQL